MMHQVSRIAARRSLGIARAPSRLLKSLPRHFSSVATLPCQLVSNKSSDVIGRHSVGRRFLDLGRSSPCFSTAVEAPDETDFQTCRRTGMRNVAIIAHVDHGKTTLVDKLLMAARRSHEADSDEGEETLSRLMDSGDMEKERGITITSKVTRVDYQTVNGESMILNIVDTPGHADFSGEVDRILSMVDGVCLLVDAAEGPMTQTKYVLSRALSAGLKPVVVLNKCDRPEAITAIDSGETENKLQELFGSLGASDDQMDYVTCYASARDGWVVPEDPLQALDLAADGWKDEDKEAYSMKHLLETVIENIPEPAVRCYDVDAPKDSAQGEDFESDRFSMAVVSVGYDNFLGRTCTGRIVSGSVAPGDKIALLPRKAENAADGPPTDVTGMFCYKGINRTPLEDARAFAGDCVTLAGVPDSVAVGDTITSASNPVEHPIETPPLIPPTLSMEFGANNGPLAGREGSVHASSKIRDRLMAETDNNVTLKAEKSKTDSDKTTVFARGELQLGILIETMRREGFEMALSSPRIITHIDPETKEEMEPFEEVIIDVDSEHAGVIVDSLTAKRKGTLVEMRESGDGKSRLTFEVSSRGLLGFGPEVATATKGSAVINHIYLEHRPHSGHLESQFGKTKLVSSTSGKATAHALDALSKRGTLFVSPGDEMYSGMVIGEVAKSGMDLEVNPVKAKELTNMRTQNKDDAVRLAPPKIIRLEELIGYMAEDEIIEVTPKSIRLRKTILDGRERERAARDRSRLLKSLQQKTQGKK